MSEDAKISLLLHEIGHCIFGRGEEFYVLDDWIKIGDANPAPPSIMDNRTTITAEPFNTYQEHYFKELGGTL